MPTRRAPCPTPGCEGVTAGGQCEDCKADAQAQRGTSSTRGYSGPGHRLRFRRVVLDRDPTCTCPVRTHRHHAGRPCFNVSTVADHHPLSRKQLLDRRLDPDDPRHGRGLCDRCHNAETAVHQPGGWHDR